MGGETETTKTTSQNQTRDPWGPSSGLLSGILGKLGGINTNLTGTESGALDSLLGNAGFLGQFTPQVSAYTNQLLGGGTDRTGLVNDAYSRYQQQLAPTAAGDYLDPNKNPWFSQVTANIGNDVMNRVNSMFAGSGRDPAGAGSYGQTVGRGITEGTAPIFAQMYNTERGRQMDAIGGLFGGGGQTAGLLSNLDQTALSNKGQGVNAARMAQMFSNDPAMQQLAVEAQRRGIPLSMLSQIAGIGLPIGQAFGSSNMTGTETSKQEQPFNWMSLAPLALMPFTGGMSGLGGAAMGGLGSGLFSALTGKNSLFGIPGK